MHNFRHSVPFHAGTETETDRIRAIFLLSAKGARHTLGGKGRRRQAESAAGFKRAIKS